VFVFLTHTRFISDTTEFFFLQMESVFVNYSMRTVIFLASYIYIYIYNAIREKSKHIVCMLVYNKPSCNLKQNILNESSEKEGFRW